MADVSLNLELNDGGVSLRYNPPSSVLLNKLYEMQVRGLYCDVNLDLPVANAPRQRLTAHSCILATASPLFLNVLAKDAKPKNVLLRNISLDILSLCINYIYGQKITVEHNRVSELKEAAKSLKLQQLILHCDTAIDARGKMLNENKAETVDGLSNRSGFRNGSDKHPAEKTKFIIQNHNTLKEPKKFATNDVKIEDMDTNVTDQVAGPRSEMLVSVQTDSQMYTFKPKNNGSNVKSIPSQTASECNAGKAYKQSVVTTPPSQIYVEIVPTNAKNQPKQNTRKRHIEHSYSESFDSQSAPKKKEFRNSKITKITNTGTWEVSTILAQSTDTSLQGMDTEIEAELDETEHVPEIPPKAEVEEQQPPEFAEAVKKLTENGEYESKYFENPVRCACSHFFLTKTGYAAHKCALKGLKEGDIVPETCTIKDGRIVNSPNDVAPNTANNDEKKTVENMYNVTLRSVSKKNTNKTKRALKCNHCNRWFLNKKNLQRHKELVAKDPLNPRLLGLRKTQEEKDRWRTVYNRRYRERERTCPICNIVIKGDNKYRAHKNEHAGVQYNCEICSYSCQSKSNIRIHMKRHKDIKDFMCAYCDYRAVTSTQVQEHEELYHLNNTYQCSKCPTTCKSARALVRHEHAHKRELLKCDYCEHTTLSKTSLRSHVIAKHFPEQRQTYVCPICHKELSCKGHCVRHMRDVHKKTVITNRTSNQMINTQDSDVVYDFSPVGNRLSIALQKEIDQGTDGIQSQTDLDPLFLSDSVSAQEVSQVEVDTAIRNVTGAHN